MNRLPSRAIVALACALLVAMTGAFAPSPARKTITVVNQCDFGIHYIYISEVGDDSWGADILNSDEILGPGESVDIEIDCGEWDVKLVAEDGSTCEVAAVDVCSADIWNVTADCGE